MSKTLQQLRDLGVEFGEVCEEFFHDNGLSAFRVYSAGISSTS